MFIIKDKIKKEKNNFSKKMLYNILLDKSSSKFEI
ncbi:hypothetical protein CWU_02595 [Buchnera aphidicola str. JF98 (Acyrthosiphon pisum)]|nr:hypothetical protein CWU_02595 [Buchnera aphidicola str. JF98 (Acyrthosiphon pisum)]